MKSWITRESNKQNRNKMIITQPKKKEYELAPEGMISAVCVDVIDVGKAMGLEADEYGRYLVPSKNKTYKAKARCKFVFELKDKMEDGRPFTQYIDMPASLYKPQPGQSGQTAKMRDYLDNWGIELPAEMPAEFDLKDLLLGKQATLRIKHEPDAQGRVWANISSINPATETVEPSGEHDAHAARERIRDRALKNTIAEAVTASTEG